MKPPQNELIADGNRQKPPRAKSVPSITSSETLNVLASNTDDISTSGSDSYPQDDSSSDEGSLILIQTSAVIETETVW